MVEAEVTVETAGDALYTAFRVAQETLNTLKVDIGDADYRAVFINSFRIAAVSIVAVDGTLTSAERLALDQIFWLDHVDADAVATDIAAHPEQAETALQHIGAMTRLACQADDVLGRACSPDENKILVAANQVFRALLGASGGNRSKRERYDNAIGRLRSELPDRPAAASSPELMPAETAQTAGPWGSVQAPATGPASPAPLLSVPCPARLRDGETCVAVSDVTLDQESNVVRRVRYGGLAARVKIIKGLSYRAGSYNVDRTRAPRIERIASGTLCVTDQRLLFLSEVKNLDLPYARLLSTSTDTGRIEVTRNNSGRLIFEQVSGPAVLAFEQLTGTSPAHRLNSEAYRMPTSSRQRLDLSRVAARGLGAMMMVALMLLALYRFTHLPG